MATIHHLREYWMKKLKLKAQVPTEGQEQENLFSWAFAAQHRYPELALLYAVPNGLPIHGPQRYAIINAAKRRGLKPGVPDVVLPVQRVVEGKRYGGLYIEIKRSDGGVLSVDQEAWIDALRAQGYKAEYCHGFEAAAELIVSYLKGAKV